MPIIVDPAVGVPAVRARSTLAAEVARYVLRPDDTEALSVAADALNDGIRNLNFKPWEWSKTSQDISLVAGTDTYTLSTAWHAPRAAALLNGSGRPVGALDWMDPKSFDIEFTDRSQNGSPCAYTVKAFTDDGLVTLDIPPSAGFVSTYPTLRLWYFARVQYLVNDSDTLGAPSEMESYILWWAKAYCASIYMPGKVGFALSRAEAIYTPPSAPAADIRRQITDWEGNAAR